jgi:PAS domain S-box-containing protein
MNAAREARALTPDDLPEACYSLMERSPVPMAKLEGTGHIICYANPAFCLLVGRSKEALVGRPFAETAQEGDGCLTVLERVLRTGEAETHTEPEGLEPHPAYWSYAVWPVLDADQHLVGVMMQVTETTSFHQQAGAMNEALLVSSVRQHELTEGAENLNEALQAEIAERKAVDEHRKLLMAELHHRVRNMLTTVQSLAMQTMRNAPTMHAFQEAFEARLEALANTHNLLMQSSSQTATLRDLITGELSHYAADDGSRYTIEGDDVSLQSKSAVPIGMLFHELATNAMKYGALSVPAGRVEVSWSLDQGARSLRVQWVETGGPAVGTPRQRGFGSRLIERGLAHELGADVRLSFDPGGVRCAMNMPLSPAPEKQ